MHFATERILTKENENDDVAMKFEAISDNSARSRLNNTEEPLLARKDSTNLSNISTSFKERDSDTSSNISFKFKTIPVLAVTIPTIIIVFVFIYFKYSGLFTADGS